MITLIGTPALTVATSAKMLPEVLLGPQRGGGVWQLAGSLAHARRVVALDATTVRLRNDPRILLENILLTAIDRSADLKAIAQDAIAANHRCAASLSLILDALP